MSPTLTGSLYIFPSDLLDEGPEVVARNCHNMGLNTVSVAMSYHQARDVIPHSGAKPRLRYRQDGVFFEPNPHLWNGVRLRPQIQSEAERDAVTQLADLPNRPSIEAWVVFLHNTTLGAQHPDTATLTCFGDRLLSNLCPSNPDVVAYARTLANDVSSRGFDILAEALSAQTFAHGHHHERSFTPISEGDEALLGLCFCEHCTLRAEKLGADTAQLRTAVRERIQAAYAGALALPATLGALADAVGNDVLLLNEARTQSVTDLVSVVASETHSNGGEISFVDLTGAVLGYESGTPHGPAAAEHAWRISVDPQSVAQHVDSYSILGYVQDTERLALDTGSYRRRVGDTRLRVILRPGYPDTISTEHLNEKVCASAESGAEQIDYYNYGMYDHQVLARIGGVKGH